MLEISFSFTNEQGERITLNQTVGKEILEHMTTFDLLTEEFKHFLLAMGFTREQVAKFEIKG